MVLAVGPDGRIEHANDRLLERSGHNALLGEEVGSLFESAVPDPGGRIGIRCSDGGTLAAELRADEELGDRRILVLLGGASGGDGPPDETAARRDRGGFDGWATAVEAARDGIAVVSHEGIVERANRAYAAFFGRDDPEDLVGSRWGKLHRSADRFDLEIRPAAERNGEWSGEVTGVGGGGDVPLGASVAPLGDGRYVCIARNVSAERGRERRLAALIEASRDLMAAGDHETVADTAVESITDAFGYRIVCLRLYEEDRNGFVRAAATAAAADLLDEEVAYDLKASNAGAAYRRGEPVRNEPTDDAYGVGSGRADLHVPLGDLGVVSVIEPDGSFSETNVRLLELFCESIRAAFERANREQTLEERQNELAVADRFNDLIAGLIDSALDSAPESELLAAVCDRLVRSELCGSACVLRTDGGERTIETGRFSGDSFFESEPEQFVESPFVGKLVAEANDHSGAAVRRRQLDAPETGDREETIAAAVPLAHGTRTFGTLILAQAPERAFGETVRGGLELLGETLGFAIVADRRRTALLTGETLELEFSYWSPLADISTEFDCRCLNRGPVGQDTRGTEHRITITSGEGETIRERLLEYDPIEACRVIESRSDRCILGVTVPAPPPEILAESGINVRSLIAADGEETIVIEVPIDFDIEEIKRSLEERWGPVELVAKRRGTDPGGGGSPLDGAGLTDRQRSALRTAQGMGYYEWPREHTAEEVADALGIASSTFHQHLRTAEAKVFERVFSDPPAGDRAGRDRNI